MNRKFYENTLKSFSQAISCKIDSIEFDVWLTKDKVPVIMHGGDEGQLNPHFKVDDKTLLVNNITFEEIRKLEFKKDPEQKIPTLEEVLDLCKDKIFLNIEIKDSQIEETFNIVVKLIEKRKMFNQIDISSFVHGYYPLVEKYNKEHEEKIEVPIYMPGFVPDGFEMRQEQFGEDQKLTYLRGKDTILFCVCPEDADLQIDTEQADKVETVTVRGTQALLLISGDRTALTWTEEQKQFLIEGNLTKEEALQMADSICIGIYIVKN